MPSPYTHLVDISLRLYTYLVLRERSESGQATVEYAMVAAFIMIIVLTATRFLGSKVTGVFSTVANSI